MPIVPVTKGCGFGTPDKASRGVNATSMLRVAARNPLLIHIKSCLTYHLMGSIRLEHSPSLPTPQVRAALFVPQGDHWVDIRSASRRRVAGQNGDRQQQAGSCH